MSGGLYIVRLRPNRTRLATFATARKVDDLGYALHQALVETFGAAALKPFRLIEKRGELLGYCPHDTAALKEYADLQRTQAQHWESASDAIGLPSLDTRPMPDRWTAGRRYRFEIRARPVVRMSHAKERGIPHERDVFCAAIDGRDPKEWPDRRETYRDWLAKQFRVSGGAEPILTQIVAMKRSKAHRRGNSRTVVVEGPDVLFAGTLQVADPGKFPSFLARGIGRHRAFGYGMLLLSPGG
ncbi:MAG: type I-E CRISPR-associated protein Cas6/Cse3/CasE [Hyphomicrobiaceae bacterium]